MSEIDDLRAQVEKHDAEIQALLDFTMHMFGILVNRDFDRSSPEDIILSLRSLKEQGLPKGDAPHTAGSLLLLLYKDLVAQRAKD